MSINYKMIHRGDYLNPEGQKKTGYYPQVVRSETVNTGELALRVARGKRLNAIDTKATIELLLACIEDELLNGNSVC
ncbi:MAG: HU family DNA-binding protein, partial [Paludibacter sp.]